MADNAVMPWGLAVDFAGKPQIATKEVSAGLHVLKVIPVDQTGAAVGAPGWTFAAGAAGIVNSAAAVTIKAAAAGLRNYLRSLQIHHDVLGAVTEVAIRDGAGGTVIWRGKLQTPAAEGNAITFETPLFSTVNTLLEVVTLTAVTGGVYVNAQGYTAP